MSDRFTTYGAHAETSNYAKPPKKWWIVYADGSAEGAYNSKSEADRARHGIEGAHSIKARSAGDAIEKARSKGWITEEPEL